MGLGWTSNESQHTKLTLEKKILPLLLLGFKLTTFRSRVWCSTNKLFQLTQQVQRGKGNFLGSVCVWLGRGGVRGDDESV